MMIIKTDVTKMGRISVFVDDEYVMSVDPDIWYSLDYTDGSEIDENELEELKTLVDSRLAYSQALRFLTLRAHSADELYKKLLKKHSASCSHFAVEKCRELGFIDDFDFAQRYAKELAEKKKYGESRIRQELRLKGIDKDIIESVISVIEIDYSSSIIDIIEKKYSGCLDDEKGRRRMFAGLMRLGFSYSDVKSALADYDFSVGDTDEY